MAENEKGFWGCEATLNIGGSVDLLDKSRYGIVTIRILLRTYCAIRILDFF